MSVRESERQKNCPSRGLGIAAAALGVGVGAALYYFFSKRAENPGEEGSTNGWDSEGHHSLQDEDAYLTISEYTTTDTSIISSNPDDAWSDNEEANDSFNQNTSNDSYHSDSYMSADSLESNNSDLDSSTESEFSTESDSTNPNDSAMSNSSVDSNFGPGLMSLFGSGDTNLPENRNGRRMTDWRTIGENQRASQTGSIIDGDEVIVPHYRPTIRSDIINGNIRLRDASAFGEFPNRSLLNLWFGNRQGSNRTRPENSPNDRDYQRSSPDDRHRPNDRSDSSFEEVDVPREPTVESRAANIRHNAIQIEILQNLYVPRLFSARVQPPFQEEIRNDNDVLFRQREWKVEECSICFDSMTADQEIFPLACTHRFHQACILPWLQEHQTCPMCRKIA